MTQQQGMPNREEEKQRPDQGQQWDPGKEQGGKEPGRERYPGQEERQRNPGEPGIPAGQ